MAISPAFLALLLLVGRVSAFQSLPLQRVPVLSSLTRRRAVSVDSSNSRSHNEEEPSTSILLGKSPKAVRLRKNLQEIWSDPSVSPIVIVGPKGSGKPSIVEELLERLPSWQTQTIHRLDMDDAASLLDTMLGTATNTSTKGEQGLLDILSDQQNTTLVLKGFESRSSSSQDELSRRQELQATVTKLLTEQSFYSRWQGREKTFQPRIVYSQHTYGSQEPEFLKNKKPDNRVLLLKVPAIESRGKDLSLISQAKINVFQKEYGLRNVQLTPEANKRLLDHTWGDGEPELDQELRNALLRLALEKKRNPYLFEGPLPFLLLSRHMLTNAPNESMRRRLLYDFPFLRRIIESPWIFDHLQRYIVAPVFVAFLVILFWGPQTRDHSAALTVFWAGWWPAVMLSFPLLGRIWCSICPFMVVGNLAQEAVTAAGVELKKWPKWVNMAGAPFAFGLFFGILVWEELWDLPQNGALSAWLLLLITSGALFNSVQFEKRMWCRHLCPIGAMCRTFGTMSMTEVRSFKANCQGCTNPQCVNGDSPVPSPTDTFALKGCTMGLKNNQLTDMGHCTLCMSCVKNCDTQVPEVNTRPLGIDYGLPWLLPPAFQDPKNMQISQVETNFYMGALLTVLQGSVLLHYMPQMLHYLDLDPAISTAAPALDSAFYIHAAATVIILALPGIVSLLVDQIAVPLENALLSLKVSWGKPTIEEEAKQRAIVDAYEALLKSDKTLEDTLEELDPDRDGNIACWEVERALKHLQLPETECETLMDLTRKRFGRRRIESMPTEAFLDAFQQLYVEARGTDDSLPTKVQLETQKTFVELFNELDEDGDGFIMPGDFDKLIDRNFRIQRSWEEKLELFRSADVVGQGRLNLFEFMTLIRKIAQAGIQEIGYGYLPLAWASLTSYWIGLGLKELGLTLERLPDTFYLDRLFPAIHLPSLVASDETVQFVQAFLVIGSLPVSIGLLQKLCDDNKISGLRFGSHVAVQVVGAWATVYLMLSSTPFVA
ncbi:nitrogen assimilation regulatory protein [Seminavis robusta]|uniref:Nitrogen assimilation regulatory protein n=1 Tax=Seminavis robusta TaxID=568900 RepID=A0A9N8HAX6_9STRA|nr:nitrogen assimilation regulatory protein [Seminavis robusta]|eukprot:Sro314_g114980.1 nitrogen assimilation regulatory protein (999) ;mRNA; f:3166-6391